MKLRLAGMLFAAATFASCTTRSVVPVFESYALDTLICEPGIAGYSVDYRFVTMANADKSPALTTIEFANINHFFELEDFEGTPQAAAAESLRQLAEAMFPAISTVPCSQPGEISVEAEALVVDSLLSYIITRASYTGGAHGMYTTECHTYSLFDGHELTTDDYFGVDSKPRIVAAIRQKLYDAYDSSNDEQLATKGLFPEYIDITENFGVTAEGVTFYYNPYEIGCYALGAVEVTFTHEELRKF